MSEAETMYYVLFNDLQPRFLPYFTSANDAEGLYNGYINSLTSIQHVFKEIMSLNPKQFDKLMWKKNKTKESNINYCKDWMYDHRQIFSLIFVPIL